MRTTLKDIAKMAGVSRPAVSMVINDPETTHLSEEKKQLVLRLAEEMGYRPNYAARQLRGKSMKLIGLIGTLFSIPVHMAIIDGIMKSFHRSGYQVLLGDHGYDPQREMEIIREFESVGVDGLIFFNATTPKIHTQTRLPIVAASHNQKKYDICTDLRLGGRLAGRHLIEHGHHHIGFMSNVATPNYLRLLGLQDALAEAGTEYKPDWTLVAGLAPEEFGKKLRHLINQDVRAFFAFNDYLGCRLLGELHKLGMSAPRDAAVIGFDGIAQTAYMLPPLTTVVQPAQRIGEECVKLMLRRIGGEPDSGEILFLEPHLHLGGSCGCEYQTNYPTTTLVN